MSAIAFSHDDLKPLRNEESQCFFLGAGFSRATGFELPVDVGFLSHDAQIYGRDIDGRPARIEACDAPGNLQEVLDQIEEEYGELASLSLEKGFSEIAIRARGVGRSWAEDDVLHEYRPARDVFRHRYDGLVDYIVRRLRVTELSHSNCSIVSQLIGSLRIQDAIVSLNYDTIVEQCLFSARNLPHGPGRRNDFMRYALGPPMSTWGGVPSRLFEPYPNDQCYVFAKLHGSVDWLACPNPDCAHYPYIEPVGPWHSNSAVDRDLLRCEGCGIRPEPVIIPPISSKDFVRFPRLNVMWLRALHALRTAKRWTFIGVSFAISRAAGGLVTVHPAQLCFANRDLNDSAEAARRLLGQLPGPIQTKSKEHSYVTLFSSAENLIKAAYELGKDRVDAVGEMTIAP